MGPRSISVVILPLPAQGHLNQLLHLARHLSGHGIPVHYVGSSAHNRQARDRAGGSWDPASAPGIRFHDIPLPPYPTPPPNPNSPVKFPAHLQPAFDAALLLSSPLSSLLQSLSSSSRRVVLIHDSTMSFAANAASSLPNVEPYAFHSVSAFTNLFFHLQSRQRPPPPSLAEYSEPTLKDCFSDEFMEFLRAQQRMTAKDHGRLLNTCRGVERHFIEQLQWEPNWREQKVFALGPLNPIAVDQRHMQHECLRWLDRQPEKSVVYVSFGTTSTLRKEQIAELAKGLASSGQRFVWALREADRGDIYAAASGNGEADGGLVGWSPERGMVVRGWAPQVEILAHRATAGFLSHCGWNSCMESMTMGVPLLTWPMHSDQPRNALLVTGVLRAGMVVRDWGKRDEILDAGAIRDSIVGFMVGDQGKEIARRAEEVGGIIRDCGESREELKAFIDYISR